jgi:hypothetical protein
MMIPRPMLTILVLVSSTLLAVGGENKPSGQSSAIKFLVLKDDNGRPVRNAAVILHPVGKDGKQGKGGFELKTDLEGRTETDGIPYGVLRVQVIAHGFQTFGNDYTIDQAEQVVTIRLKRPTGQYTIYGKPGSSPPKDQQ